MIISKIHNPITYNNEPYELKKRRRGKKNKDIGDTVGSKNNGVQANADKTVYYVIPENERLANRTLPYKSLIDCSPQPSPEEWAKQTFPDHLHISGSVPWDC